ncbi:UBN2_2 domain-containing protein [Cephalotus follicularis]|uniref:UBN2_2 domain-containing protein n=1 Tax=Cephalotus follicularis TaxID=3775 RepID=A0A1Q3BDL0_CEPFO|nr:UBN2_2 domain-containing protein [Cephalotus follicularis]
MYKKESKNSITGHLRIMSAMIRDLKNAENVLYYEKQVQTVIRSLPYSWISTRQILTHNENIKNFDNVSRHVELEAGGGSGPHYCSFYPWGKTSWTLVQE